MKKEIYTPMEKILVEGTKQLTTKELVADAIQTKEQLNNALELDQLLLELEAKANLMDGLTMEEWLLC